jgi:hypothetical protein
VAGALLAALLVAGGCGDDARQDEPAPDQPDSVSTDGPDEAQEPTGGTTADQPSTDGSPTDEAGDESPSAGSESPTKKGRHRSPSTDPYAGDSGVIPDPSD